VRGLDRNELRVLAEGPTCEPFPRYLYPACRRLMKRGVLAPFICNEGHLHLEPGPNHRLAVMCHKYATKQVEVT
jgi:hypothetical protein